MDLVMLRALARRYPDTGSVLAELANLSGILALPKLTVHVVSDVHGEHAKLRQVINNASGSLRPLVVRVLAGKLAAGEIDDFLQTIYDPRTAWRARPADRERLLVFVERAGLVIRELASRCTLKHVDRLVPDPYDPIVRELVFGDVLVRPRVFLDRLVAPFLAHDQDLELVRMLARLVRNLAVGELVVAGDLGDRGPRIDKVIETLMQQPSVSITWGNHDASWLAACLGHPAAIATVVRLSLRYQRLAQLEEGYGISLGPVEVLARTVYGDDPAECFAVKGDAPDPLLLARMQKAAAILQFKLEGALFQRRPEWQLEQRALLHRIDPAAGTIEIDGVRYPLRDTRFPTIDWADPYVLAPAEQACLDALIHAFTDSQVLWKHASFVVSHGQMWLRRDLCAIFHGCVPVDDSGEFLELVVDGEARRGRELFEAIETVVQRAFRRHSPDDVDLLFYLWTGPRSPCFGKDRMATLETYLVADKATHEENKNPYFALIRDAAFCARVLAEFGADPERGFIVNGHVPVRLDAGEQPIKKSGRAITIDGAFAAAYGDKGFSLVLDPERIYLAQHHHFEAGGDIIPTVSEVVVHDRLRTVADTEKGPEIFAEIRALEGLATAFDANLVRPL
jgi:fructose-1,6-bisphosphatase-3